MMFALFSNKKYAEYLNKGGDVTSVRTYQI